MKKPWQVSVFIGYQALEYIVGMPILLFSAFASAQVFAAVLALLFQAAVLLLLWRGKLAGWMIGVLEWAVMALKLFLTMWMLAKGQPSAGAFGLFVQVAAKAYLLFCLPAMAHYNLPGCQARLRRRREAEEQYYQQHGDAPQFMMRMAGGCTQPEPPGDSQPLEWDDRYKELPYGDAVEYYYTYGTVSQEEREDLETFRRRQPLPARRYILEAQGGPCSIVSGLLENSGLPIFLELHSSTVTLMEKAFARARLDLEGYGACPRRGVGDADGRISGNRAEMILTLTQQTPEGPLEAAAEIRINQE